MTPEVHKLVKCSQILQKMNAKWCFFVKWRHGPHVMKNETAFSVCVRFQYFWYQNAQKWITQLLSQLDSKPVVFSSYPWYEYSNLLLSCHCGGWLQWENYHIALFWTYTTPVHFHYTCMVCIELISQLYKFETKVTHDSR